MEPLAVDLRLFAELSGSALRLTPGRGLMARVVEAADGRGLLNIAGALVEAQLPRHIRAGEQLRLVVRHLDSSRVVLELPQAAPAAPAAVPLPGGGTLTVAEDASGSPAPGSGET